MNSPTSTARFAEGKLINYKELWGIQDDEYPIMVTTAFVVKLDKDGILDWQTTEALDAEMKQKLGVEKTSAVFNRVAILRSYPTGHLRDDQNENYFIMIGEGLARALEFDVNSAMQMFDTASDYAVARNQEIARLWYVVATGLSTSILCIAFLVVWFNRITVISKVGNTAFEFVFAFCVGTIGAFFSVLLRIGKSPLDPSAGWKLHALEGFSRTIVGGIGAGVAHLAMNLGLVLSILNDKGQSGMFLVAFVAGFSERFVRTLIKRVEMDSADKADAKAEGK